MSSDNTYDIEKFLRNININKFIQEVEFRPCLWNLHDEMYSNRMVKQAQWCDVCKAMCEQYNELSDTEQAEILTGVLKKWKGLRNSFSRELAKRKKTSKGTWKTYVYFDQLSFLVQCAWPRNTSTDPTVEDDPQEWKTYVEENTDDFSIESKADIETVYMSDRETIVKDPFHETNSVELPLTEFRNEFKRPKIEVEEPEIPSSSNTLMQESAHPLLVFFSGLLPDYDKLTPKHQRLFKQNSLTYLNELLDKQESQDGHSASYHDL